ncbi:glycosyltransferase family 1 protein [Paenibacillus sp. ACRRX]|uniref:glycosyltransferase family 4 protein n=1 Tax=Paenibacillus sp. ACRRX TaxID=2918206 RepID=UPI0023B77DDD|nr:glycosyltransferase family 1 protein [Paenibacillus sp. ACRRX]
MKVCIDGQPLLGPLTGIGRYTAELLKVLNTYEDLTISVGLNQILKQRKLNSPVPSTCSIYNSRYPYKVIRRLMKPNFLYKFRYDEFINEPFDVYHGTNYTHIPIKKQRYVVNIHDLAFMKYPETTSSKIYNHHMKWVPYSAASANHIIALSESAKADIVSLLNINPEKITVIPLAADARFKPLENQVVRPILQKYNMPDQYILCVGTIEARKNLITVVKAYHQLTSKYLLDHKLVIVGTKGWKTSSLYEYIERHKLQSCIHFAGYVDDEDLPAIYNGATMLTMPSLYEGFGLPLVEAMQCGVPVIGSNVSSIPEVIGDGGILCSPHEPEDWADQILNVLHEDSNYLDRKRLALSRSSTFSWKLTADKTYNIYTSV